MAICDSLHHWGTEPAERTRPYPCDRYAEAPYARVFRAVDVEAPASVVYRWLCQMKVAPYSYDWLDNLGRRSPERLTPGVDNLAVGQRVMIGRITEFVPDRHLTLVTTDGAARLFGPISFTYQVTPTGEATSRLLVCLAATARSRPARLRRRLLEAGDLVMMRKQLLTLKAYAERDHAESAPGGGPR